MSNPDTKALFVHLPAALIERLDQAVAERKQSGQLPRSKRDITQAALEQWLRKHGPKQSG